ncbi:nitroreductase family deazaflavin-dependent oxidoreductase [Granulicoccus phenolivorans]|uniref:nitroreductase family deazaflavin-dependent oxidoreductase n=1 Tax=Granulicoccus phenolivorans TaxID=266854 RepID=UPI000425E556|nr:nitroreductase family deazaflavin-dependent oxidoreductase [Granulicoccus phenolivorans]
MAIQGTWVPGANPRATAQVEQIQQTGTTDGITFGGKPVVLLTMLGRSGKVRKVPLMRVEHDGKYAVVASKGGAPDHPQWYDNLVANPDLDLQDGTEIGSFRARELSGPEREVWWERCVSAYPPYLEYTAKTDRVFPVLLLEPVSD